MEEARNVFIIDNGLMYSSRHLYFVEASRGFGAWLKNELVPWLNKASLPGETLELLVRAAAKRAP